MQKHTAGAMTSSLSAALAALLLVVGSSAAVADGGKSRSGRSSVSSGRQAGQSANRMGRAARRTNVRGGRYTVGRDRGGKRFGWFNRGGRYSERAFISVGGGSYGRGYRSYGGFFFGFSFTASEYR